MKNSRFNRLSAICLVASVSFATLAQAATDTSLTNQTISTVIDDDGGPNTVPVCPRAEPSLTTSITRI